MGPFICFATQDGIRQGGVVLTAIAGTCAAIAGTWAVVAVIRGRIQSAHLRLNTRDDRVFEALVRTVPKAKRRSKGKGD